jgi:hypothetical protein
VNQITTDQESVLFGGSSTAPVVYSGAEGHHIYGQTSLEKSLAGKGIRDKRAGNMVEEKRPANITRARREAALQIAEKLFAFNQTVESIGIPLDQRDHYFTRFNNWPPL